MRDSKDRTTVITICKSIKVRFYIPIKSPAFVMPDLIRHPEFAEVTIGVGKPGYPGSPPSEPDMQISRNRLSVRWLSS